MYDPVEHIRASRIIARHSTNHDDVREVVAGLLPLDRAGRILDLGCGYGFLHEILKGRLPSGAEVIGIDANADNGPHFLARVAACGARGTFHAAQLDSTLPFGNARFDLVLAVYSLYFFPGLVPEIRRVLRPDGCFATVTHRRDSLCELDEAVGDARLFDVIDRFSDVGGEALLRRSFSRVRTVPYPNRLAFSPSDADDLACWLRFKRPDWMPEARVEAIVSQVLATLGSAPLSLSKSDVIYVCQP